MILFIFEDGAVSQSEQELTTDNKQECEDGMLIAIKFEDGKFKTYFDGNWNMVAENS